MTLKMKNQKDKRENPGNRGRYCKRLKEGEPYQDLSKTVAVNLLNYDLIDEETRFHNCFRFIETETQKELTDIAEIHFMELPSLRRYIEKNRGNITKIIGKEKLLDWLLFIDNPNSDDDKLAENADKAIGRAKEMLRKLSADERLQEEYEARYKAVMDYNSAIKTAINLFKMGMSVEQISEATNLSVKELNKIFESNRKS
ncbi:MAG TPA: Rpn family recombination-promoting nuclease/putative transposase [Thermotogota bacterium]|nr:Rpn family recombination-promoting nuclease/putative transposase [Thermotogota bacterium]